MFCLVSPVALSPAWSVEGQYIENQIFLYCPPGETNTVKVKFLEIDNVCIRSGLGMYSEI